VLINKVDLPPLWDLDDLGDVGDSPVLEMSLLVDGTQVVNRLADAILGLVGSGSIASSAGSRALITRTRHKQALQQAQQALHNSLATLQQGLPLDLIAVDLYAALEFLGEITGETVRENVLDRIFAQFCIGK
jgi:tRNA modification GTPase